MDNKIIATGDVIGSMVRRRIKDQKYNQYLGDTLRRLTVKIDYQDTIIMSGLRLLEKLFDYRWRGYVSDALYVNDPSILSQKAAKNSLRATIEEIFGDGVIEWNRIALVVTIVCLLADEALRIGNISRVLHYVTWTEEYFRSKLIDAWIDRKNGWAEIYHFARLREEEMNATFCTALPRRKPKETKSPSPTRRERSKTAPNCQTPVPKRNCADVNVDAYRKEFSKVANSMKKNKGNEVPPSKSLDDISPSVHSPNHVVHQSKGKLPENTVSTKKSARPDTLTNSGDTEAMNSKQRRLLLSKPKSGNRSKEYNWDEESKENANELWQKMEKSDWTTFDVTGAKLSTKKSQENGLEDC